MHRNQSSRWATVGAAFPGVGLMVLALAGWIPTLRDLTSYFLPLRARLAAVLTHSASPFWTPDVGCGESFFANPQSGVLYPPAWFPVVFSPTVSLGLEIGLHLAILGVGIALLARTLRCSPWLQLAAGWTVVFAGPVITSAGVLNNLDTLAWLPWIWWSALRGKVVPVAVFVALAWLGGEPQLAAIGVLVALTLVPRRTLVVAILLGGGMVAVQAIPFIVWVSQGDRGSQSPASGVSSGALSAADLLQLAIPEQDGSTNADRFVTGTTVAFWALVYGVVALFRGRGAERKLAIWGWLLLAVGVIAGTGAGGAVWLWLTHGLVRYPSRLLFVAVVALAPAAAAMATRHRLRWRVIVPLVVALVIVSAIVHRRAPVESLGQGVTSALVMAGPLAGPAAVLAPLLLAPHDGVALRMERPPLIGEPLCLEAQISSGRVYVVEASVDQFRWALRHPRTGKTSLGWGYTPLLDSRRTVRSWAPLQSARLTEHLAMADEGPAQRWWLNALGADRVVAPHPVPGFEPVCSRDGLNVYGNPQAWPIAALAAAVPAVHRPPRWTGTLTPVRFEGHVREWHAVLREPGVFLWLETPDPGWDVTIDGQPARRIAAPGIIQAFRVDAGTHTIEARYQPAGFLAGGGISLLSLIAVVLMVRRRMETGRPPAAGEI